MTDVSFIYQSDVCPLLQLSAAACGHHLRCGEVLKGVSLPLPIVSAIYPLKTQHLHGIGRPRRTDTYTTVSSEQSCQAIEYTCNDGSTSTPQLNADLQRTNCNTQSSYGDIRQIQQQYLRVICDGVFFCPLSSSWRNLETLILELDKNLRCESKMSMKIRTVCNITSLRNLGILCGNFAYPQSVLRKMLKKLAKLKGLDVPGSTLLNICAPDSDDLFENKLKRRRYQAQKCIAGFNGAKGPLEFIGAVGNAGVCNCGLEPEFCGSVGVLWSKRANLCRDPYGIVRALSHYNQFDASVEFCKEHFENSCLSTSKRNRELMLMHLCTAVEQMRDVPYRNDPNNPGLLHLLLQTEEFVISDTTRYAIMERAVEVVMDCSVGWYYFPVMDARGLWKKTNPRDRKCVPQRLMGMLLAPAVVPSRLSGCPLSTAELFAYHFPCIITKKIEYISRLTNESFFVCKALMEQSRRSFLTKIVEQHLGLTDERMYDYYLTTVFRLVANVCHVTRVAAPFLNCSKLVEQLMKHSGKVHDDPTLHFLACRTLAHMLLCNDIGRSSKNELESALENAVMHLTESTHRERYASFLPHQQLIQSGLQPAISVGLWELMQLVASRHESDGSEQRNCLMIHLEGIFPDIHAVKDDQTSSDRNRNYAASVISTVQTTKKL